MHPLYLVFTPVVFLLMVVPLVLGVIHIDYLIGQTTTEGHLRGMLKAGNCLPEQLEQWLDKYPKSPVVLYTWCDLAREKFGLDGEETHRRVKIFRARQPRDDRACLMHAKCLFAVGDAVGAEAILIAGRHRRREPEDTQLLIYSDHAVLAEKQGMDDEALLRWINVQSAFPKAAEGLIGQARVLTRQHKFSQADVVLIKAIARAPKDLRAVRMKAQVASKLHDWAAAAEAWKTFRSLDSQTPEGYLGGAEACINGGAFFQAAALLDSLEFIFRKDTAALAQKDCLRSRLPFAEPGGFAASGAATL